MEINKKELRFTIFILVVIGAVMCILYFASSNQEKIWPWILAFAIVATIIVIPRHFIKISQEKKEKMTSIMLDIRIIGGALLLYEGTFLGIKFHNFWLYLIAVVGAYLLIKGLTRLGKKIVKINEKIEDKLSKKLNKKYNN